MDRRQTSRLRQIAVRPILTWVALCLLLAATCGFSYLPLGRANLVIALAIAAVKAGLVAMIFMRLAENNPLARLAALAGPIWIFIMFVLMGSDYFTR